MYCLLVFTLPLGSAVFAQDAQKPETSDATVAATQTAHFYRLDFVIQELAVDGKPVNSRSYSTIVSTDRKYPSVQVRAGSKVPITTSSNSGESTQQRTEFQYQDIGVNIDILPGFTREVGGELSFDLSVEVSSIASAVHLGGSGGMDEPVVRQNRWSGAAVIPVGKSTPIFTSDNLDDKGALQVLVTATLLQ
jgi:hypothetical protein